MLPDPCRPQGLPVKLFSLQMGNSGLIWANNERSNGGCRAATTSMAFHSSSLTAARRIRHRRGHTRFTWVIFLLMPSNLNTQRATLAEDHRNSGKRPGNIYWLQDYNVKLKKFSCFTSVFFFFGFFCSTEESRLKGRMQACVRFNLPIRPCPNCILQLEPQPQALSSPSASVLCKTHKQHRCACRNLNRPRAHPRYSFKKVPSGVCLAVVVLLCETLAGLSFPPKIVKTKGHRRGSPPTPWVHRAGAVRTRWESDGRRYLELTSSCEGWTDVRHFSMESNRFHAI